MSMPLGFTSDFVAASYDFKATKREFLDAGTKNAVSFIRRGPKMRVCMNSLKGRPEMRSMIYPWMSAAALYFQCTPGWLTRGSFAIRAIASWLLAAAMKLESA